MLERDKANVRSRSWHMSLDGKRWRSSKRIDLPMFGQVVCYDAFDGSGIHIEYSKHDTHEPRTDCV